MKYSDPWYKQCAGERTTQRSLCGRGVRPLLASWGFNAARASKNIPFVVGACFYHFKDDCRLVKGDCYTDCMLTIRLYLLVPWRSSAYIVNVRSLLSSGMRTLNSVIVEKGIRRICGNFIVSVAQLNPVNCDL